MAKMPWGMLEQAPKFPQALSQITSPPGGIPRRLEMAPQHSPSKGPALFLPREKVSAAGWVGVARGSGNQPKAPPPPASRPTACPPGERRLFFQKLRGFKRTVCAPQGQVGKWSRRRRGEEAKGGEWGAPRLHQVPTFGSCPSVFNPLGVMGRTSKEEGLAPGKTTEARTCSYPTNYPPFTAFLTPRKWGQRWAPGGTERGEGATSLRRTPLHGPPLFFLRSPTISSFPRQRC